MVGIHRMVRVQVGPADAGPHGADDRIGRVLDDRVGNGLDADVAGALHESRKHVMNSLVVGLLLDNLLFNVRGSGWCARY